MSEFGRQQQATPPNGEPRAKKKKNRLQLPVRNDGTPTDLLREAEKHANDVEVPRRVLAFLYRQSRVTWAWRPWVRRVKTACAIDYVLRGNQSGFGNLSTLIKGADKLKALPPGTLLVTFHGGFVVLARWLYESVLPGALQIHRAGRLGTRDHRSALFNAVRAVQDGQTVLIAPDGPDGSTPSQLSVLGSTSPVADGAAFIAYTSGCNMAWFTLTRLGRYFIVNIQPGPRRNADESFDQYKARFLAFYADKIEQMLTGEPRNISLSRRWIRTLRQASLEGKAASPNAVKKISHMQQG